MKKRIAICSKFAAACACLLLALSPSVALCEPVEETPEPADLVAPTTPSEEIEGQTTGDDGTLPLTEDPSVAAPQGGGQDAAAEQPALTALAQAQADPGRIEKKLNGSWTFIDGGNETEVSVPHSWTYFASFNPMLNIKTCTYKRQVEVSDMAGKKLYLFFEGVNKTAVVSIDGEEVGRHTGGFSSFAFDVTDACAGKQTVELSVEVTNLSFDTMPINTDFTHYAGIYRDVYLIATDARASISNQDYGSNGVYYDTSVNAQARTATLSPRVVLNAAGTSENPVEATVKTVLSTADDSLVGEVQVSCTFVSAASSFEVALPSMSVGNVRLWNGTEDPYLYSVTTSVYVGDEKVDSRTTHIGFRTFEVKDGQFYLNGEAYELHGVGMHQEYGCETNVTTHEQRVADVEMVREMGANALRLSHYPHSQDMFDLCDQYGIVVWTEIPFYLIMLDTDTFKNNALQCALEMVKQGYNHPSIVIWGIENEVNYNSSYAAYYPTQGSSEQIGAFMRQLAQAIKSVDQTRLVGQAQLDVDQKVKETASWSSADSGIDTTGFNIYQGWYGTAIHGPNQDKKISGIVEGLRKKVAEYQATFADASSGTMSFVFTEYGAGANADQHVYLDDSFGWNTPGGYSSGGEYHFEEYQSWVHEGMIMALYGDKTNGISPIDGLWASFAWAMYDFANYRNEGGMPYVNTKGLVTADRQTKKDAFYLYKANWNDEDKFVHITAKGLENYPASDQQIKVYSNCSQVELVVNGESAGFGTLLQDGVFVWNDVPLSLEQNDVVAKGYESDSPVCQDECDSWIGEGKQTPERTIADGIYAIASADDENQVLDVVAGSTEPGTNVTLYSYFGTDNQKWQVTRLDNGYYTLSSVATGQMLDAVAAGNDIGTNVTQWPSTGADNQQWLIEDAGDGYFRIVTKYSDLRLDVQGGKAGDGVNVWLYSKTDNNEGRGQKFKFAAVEDDGFYTIRSADDKMYVLDVEAASISDGANVSLYHFLDTRNQKWQIYSTGCGKYKIAATHSWMALDVVAGCKDYGTNVTQWSQYATDNQAWEIERQLDGSVKFKSVATGLYLDVQGGFAGDTVNVWTWGPSDANGGAGQRFCLEKTSL